MPLIQFNESPVSLPSEPVFAFTNSSFQSLLNQFQGGGLFSDTSSKALQLVSKLSLLNHLIITREKDTRKGTYSYKVHTIYGNLTCVLQDDASFLIVAFNPANLDSQNRAIRSGVTFDSPRGCIYMLKLPKYNTVCKYKNGRQLDYDSLSFISPERNARIIKQVMGEKDSDLQAAAQQAAPEESSIESIQLAELLDLSDKYASLTHELEETKAAEQGRLSYSSFTASEYERTDRIAYQFITDSLNKSVFKAGTQVEIPSWQGEALMGSIVETDESDPKQPKVTILFNRQFDRDQLEPSGWINLSVSALVREVQLSATEKIRSRTAKSTYMENVLGGFAPSGFEQKDLTQVRAALQKQKYPPNASQITAIEKGINTKDVFLVMGPPGTGKTTVILEWVKYFVNVEHKRVLVSSQNNKAVDNVLSRLAEEKSLDMIRLGSEAKLQAEVIPYMYENRLADLNKSIDKATASALSRLDRTIAEWTEYLEHIQPLAAPLQKMASLKDDLKKEAADSLVPAACALQDLVDKFSEYQSACRSLLKKRRKKQLWRDRFSRWPAFLQFIARFFVRHFERRMEELAEEYRSFHTRSKDVCSEYASLHTTYLAMLEEMKEKFTRAYSSELTVLDQCWEHSAKNRRPENPGFAGLFEQVSLVRKGLNLENLMRTRSLVNSELKRTEALRSCEQDWRNGCVGTQNYSLGSLLLEAVDLVGATCIGINTQKRFANIDFDVTIIDEAGQIQIHNALVPMSVSNKLIMLGDYKQIPPSADQELLELCASNGVPTEFLTQSLFEFMFGQLPDSNKIMLDTQYRMPAEIADTISEWFYQGNYHSPDFKRNQTGLIPRLSEKPFIVIDTSQTPGRYETRTPEGSSFNALECSVCADLLKFITESDLPLPVTQIGIISAYKEQVGRIRSAISKIVTPQEASQMVATLDSFQGQERSLILYSFTKSSGKYAGASRIGFLNELRRLNVAMSRCTETMVLIGDMTFLSQCQHQRKDEFGQPIYAHSEKEFSDFIRKMLTDVKNGRGELISYAQFKERLGSN